MTPEEEIRAAIIVTPEMIAFVSAQINYAAEQLGKQSSNFVEFVHSIDPRLKRHEAMLLTAAFLENLPGLCQDSPEVINSLRHNADFLIKGRNEKTQN
ncbi:hypothetical protein VF14_11540 [Nostoc linckia z18]|uniref:Uncharacterized protein n=2 Tax=Nostoc linckia TaxID=92942 RepID=A0A9Q5Z9Z9_NOSLI|nr:hypothetical protein [Nostoc linckia]PHK40912.1 hypothetical protein VF12_08710 [Nostoc linckia z15]PHK46455.1 hypothetical protein VF13_10945 [Nostoc linckia z16]PHJ60255.1 hypothetical protein VF02_23100 [Nostoc linckia z1]PHJ63821.1 hypothetical protein VF05_24065 [Nostoc linckia z3]PHJ70835.1 hypothetical protein VF03_21635 [Nostoc linckia z2]